MTTRRTTPAGPVAATEQVAERGRLARVVTAAAVAVPAAAAAMCVFTVVVVARQHRGVARVPAWLPWTAWTGTLAGLVVILIVGVGGSARDTDPRPPADRVGLTAADRLWLKVFTGAAATAVLCGLTSAVMFL